MSDMNVSEMQGSSFVIHRSSPRNACCCVMLNYTYHAQFAEIPEHSVHKMLRKTSSALLKSSRSHRVLRDFRSNHCPRERWIDRPDRQKPVSFTLSVSSRSAMDQRFRAIVCAHKALIHITDLSMTSARTILRCFCAFSFLKSKARSLIGDPDTLRSPQSYKRYTRSN
jgi:hypothetical protein